MTNDTTKPSREKLTIPLAGKTARIYEIKVTDATAIWEIGTGYSLDRWGEDTDRIKGYDEDTGRVLEFAPGVEAYLTTNNDAGFVFVETGKRLLWEEMFDHHGHTIDSRFGRTRPEDAGDEPMEGMDELRDALRINYGY